MKTQVLLDPLSFAVWLQKPVCYKSRRMDISVASWARRRARAFGYAARGLRLLITNHPHGRIHALAAFIAIALGFAVEIDRLEWMAILLCICFVFATEALNSAIEELSNALHPEHHPGIGRAKDLAAGAVLISGIVSIVVACIVFGARLVEALGKG